ncbi:ferrous iron transport protein B [Candidatus Woesearchaeota archaeon]|nr:ferrous iron transport protein B [Candidatus Woesearchaeota archaeon]
MKSCHDEGADVKGDETNIIALVGNPNTGKSVVFHKLTGIYTTVSNYPGTTLNITTGKYKEHTIVDTPGVYGISSISTEERITTEIVLKASGVVNIVNAACLERELFLTLQLIDMGLPTVVVLNFMDEAEKQGLLIDVKALSSQLGVRVIPTVAVTGSGIADLKTSLAHIESSSLPVFGYERGMDIDAERLLVLHSIKNRAEHILALEGDGEVGVKYSLNTKISPDKVYTQRRKRVNAIIRTVVTENPKKRTFKKKLASLMVHPVFGFFFLAAILYIAYLVVGVFVAQTVVNFTEKTIMQGYYVPYIKEMVGFFDLPVWLYTLFAGEFGILTMTLTYIVGILLPLVVSFYILLSLLEDSGYLPRLAFLVDKTLTRFGLNGKAVIPLMLGFGCVTMATITTRMLDTKREKDIASTLLNFAIPCSAQLAVITALIATAGGYFTLVYVSIIFACFVILGTVLHKVLPGHSSSLVLSLPSLQLPRIKNIIMKTFVRTKYFLLEAGIWFLIGAVIMSVFQLTGTLELLKDLISPIVVNWMGLPKEAATAYVMGIVRRDFGAAGFYNMALPSLQLLVALVSITLFVPCIAAIMILYKERGAKIATAIWVGTIVTAFLIGGLIFKIGVVLNVL